MEDFGLVLGAGGAVGWAYHCGALRALEQVGGVHPDDAELVVGTSAGSAIGAYLRSGWSTEELWQFATGTHPSLAELDPEELDAQRSAMFTRAWASPPELARRAIGSAYVMARSLARAPALRIPGPLARRYPGGLFAMSAGEERFASDLGDSWPERALWLVTVDIVSGRRVVLGREGSPETTLARAVLASCAIPGIYRPVRVGRRVLVDGGAHSTTNLDLAAKAGCRLAICVAPMAWDPATRLDPLRQVVRLQPARTLSGEARRARRRGTEVLLVRPTATELALHPTNAMRADVGERVAHAAYDATARLLDTDRFRQALAGSGGSRPATIARS